MTDAEIGKEVFSAIRNGISKSIESSLGSGHSSPITPLITAAIHKHQAELSKIMNDAISDAIAGDFREKLREVAVHKIAKVLISKMEGEIEKKANDLRSDPEFRARLTLAISNLIKGI